MMNTADFIQHGCKANPWVQLPGFHPSMVVFDWLHVVDLALIPDSAASCLIELTEVPLEQGGISSGSDQNERLRAAYVDFIAECRKHKISRLRARLGFICSNHQTQLNDSGSRAKVFSLSLS